ncbi:MAG: SEC-C domain-containing protein [candidate division Zixibacteria bacterium]|nr:SEC-C domain-containing protein [candidate division Zixibacteria bacterium]
MEINNPRRRQFELKGKLAEEIIHHLAYQSFLKEWCYPNPKDEKGKEICDLLVVLDSSIIVIQVKDIKFSGNEERYTRKAIDDPVKQVLGAERRLLDYGCRVKLKNAHGYSHTFDPNDVSEIQRVVLTVGDGFVRRKLAVVKKGKVIHIFDRDIATIMNELDTIADFQRYLKCRENFILAEHAPSLLIMSELDLLATYIHDGKSLDKFTRADHVIVSEGCWEEVIRKPEYIARVQENRVSYIWDSIVDYSRECPGDEYREIAKEMSRPDRFQRRCLSKAFLGAREEAFLGARKEKNTERGSFTRVYVPDSTTTTYVFIVTPASWDRTRRSARLINTCLVARDKYRNNKRVFGLATDYDMSSNHVFEFALLDYPKWSKLNQRVAEDLRKDQKILVRRNVHHVSESEYPGTSMPPEPPGEITLAGAPHQPRKRREIGRNEPCPCDSGKKYKKCCGK